MTNFIVDTSVWIDHFKGSLSFSVREKLFDSLKAGRVLITDIIRHEILVGARSEIEFHRLKKMFHAIGYLSIQESEKEEFEKFSWKLAKIGLLGKYTDSSIAFLAHHHKVPVLTFDRYFDKLKQKGLIEVVE